jgi:hypothetical protein
MLGHARPILIAVLVQMRLQGEVIGDVLQMEKNVRYRGKEFPLRKE